MERDTETLGDLDGEIDTETDGDTDTDTDGEIDGLFDCSTKVTASQILQYPVAYQ